MEKSGTDVGLDITKNIKTIEILKSRLLSEIAFLHENMVKVNPEKEERVDVLSEIVILTYMLSSKLGIDYNALDEKIINKLKLAVLQDSGSFSDINKLLKHIDKNNQW